MFGEIVKNLPSQISSAQFASHCFFAVASVFSPHIYEWKSPRPVLQNQACLTEHPGSVHSKEAQHLYPCDGLSSRLQYQENALLT